MEKKRKKKYDNKNKIKTVVDNSNGDFDDDLSWMNPDNPWEYDPVYDRENCPESQYDKFTTQKEDYD